MIGKLLPRTVVTWNGPRNVSPLRTFAQSPQSVLASPPLVRSIERIGNQPNRECPTRALLPQTAAAHEHPATVSTRRAAFAGAGASWMPRSERGTITFNSVRNLTKTVGDLLQSFHSNGGNAPTGGISVGHVAPARPMSRAAVTPTPAEATSIRSQSVALHDRSPSAMATVPVTTAGNLSPPPSPPPMPGEPGSMPASPFSASLRAASEDSATEPFKIPRTIRPSVVRKEQQDVIDQLQAVLRKLGESGSAAIMEDRSTASVDKHQVPVAPTGAAGESIRFNGKLFERVALKDANRFVRDIRKTLTLLARTSNA